MELSIKLHPDSEAAITALRLSPGLCAADGRTPNFDTNEALAAEIVNEHLVKVALQRHPPADMAATLKAAQEAFDTVAKAEFEKRLKPVEAAAVKV